MKIIVLTQEEYLYLPDSFAAICKEYSDEIVCIVTCPAMTLHGSAFKGVLRYVRFFGIKGTFVLACRTLSAKVKTLLLKPSFSGPFHSIKQVAHAFSIPFYYVS